MGTRSSFPQTSSNKVIKQTDKQSFLAYLFGGEINILFSEHDFPSCFELLFAIRFHCIRFDLRVRYDDDDDCSLVASHFINCAEWGEGMQWFFGSDSFISF